jgi:hypothetical protein
LLRILVDGTKPDFSIVAPKLLDKNDRFIARRNELEILNPIKDNHRELDKNTRQESSRKKSKSHLTGQD